MSSVIWMSVTHGHPVLLNSLYQSSWEGKGVHGRNFTHVVIFFSLWFFSLGNAGSDLNFLLKFWDRNLVDGLYWTLKYSISGWIWVKKHLRYNPPSCFTVKWNQAIRSVGSHEWVSPERVCTADMGMSLFRSPRPQSPRRTKTFSRWNSWDGKAYLVMEQVPLPPKMTVIAISAAYRALLLRLINPFPSAAHNKTRKGSKLLW